LVRAWCQWAGADGSTALQLDAVRAAFFVHLLLDGYDLTAGSGTVTVLRLFLLGHLGGGLPRLRRARAVVGWRKLSTPHRRRPRLRAAMDTGVGYLLRFGSVGTVIFVARVFDAYPRFSVGYRLPGDRPAPAASGAGAVHGHQGFIANRGDDGVLGKTAMTDESVAFDSPHLWDVLIVFKSARPGVTCP